MISHLLGKRIFMFLLNRKWEKLYKKDLGWHIKDLNIEIVGGLNKRGWTVHDIDVVGNRNDVVIFNDRIRGALIKNPIHYCGSSINHSHLMCLFNGVKLIFGRNGF
ncbi:TPA: hypothetical protein DCX62_02070 [Candidatus Azambacteria bacterium]|nr:MAG: hypothetical protein A3K28_00355 [Candidatus Azambacteria bacterium RIFOXYB1_FULL_40_33]OGD42376.1 MAG: hypothetical protein A2193_00365 [Candidatus Azambacteria bacterium RIFOXYA1_FULL_42_37]HAJ44404.1 hypothetical protein [Candidatus Azambacteria bacterium]HAN61693.1 hypothetical protein [Candidatus Azambacteria bacterium]HAX39027.1 hypothetical protein [Candidatus Azambacteria bacterium]